MLEGVEYFRTRVGMNGWVPGWTAKPFQGFALPSFPYRFIVARE